MQMLIVNLCKCASSFIISSLCFIFDTESFLQFITTFISSATLDMCLGISSKILSDVLFNIRSLWDH